MRLLLIDTCGTAGSVALAEGDAIVAGEVLPGRSASERLVPVVRILLEFQGWSLRELSAIVVVHGPGSFTGMRVGLSAAKGLSEAVGVPIVAISRLAVLAAGHGKAVLDAGRGEFYFGDYSEGRCVQEALLTRDELIAVVKAEPVAVCEAKVVAALETTVPMRVVAEPKAADALALAAARMAVGAFDDAATLDANYLRRTDVQLFAWAKPVVI
jgi:tRNA threonylcarbamoyladenosine biosynthesis protein TsaB